MAKFSDEVIEAIQATLPAAVDPMRRALLPELLGSWAAKELGEHLSLESKAKLRKQDKQLSQAAVCARDLLDAFSKMDRRGFFRVAIEPEMRRTGKSPYTVSVDVATLRRHHALDWLKRFTESFSDSGAKSKFSVKSTAVPDKKARGYLVMLDLAAIFELVTATEATRRVDFETGKEYGPFREFVGCVWRSIFETDTGCSYALRVWADRVAKQRGLATQKIAEAEAKFSRSLTADERDDILDRVFDISTFELNLRLRHPDVWRKLIDLQA
jgi:hypothetical protein